MTFAKDFSAQARYPHGLAKREETMTITRRQLAAAGALALGASSLLRSAPSLAESAEEKAVEQAVEVLRKALMEKDKTRLEQLAADQLSYGHSSGKVESKSQFVDGVMTSKAIVKSIAFPELSIAVVGDAAIARHLFEAEMETDGKPNSVKIGALQVWQKQDGNWKLLARQGFKLA
jgi:ketosteroid isomerase-like protein